MEPITTIDPKSCRPVSNASPNSSALNNNPKTGISVRNIPARAADVRRKPAT
jgi:hypothetical protein